MGEVIKGPWIRHDEPIELVDKVSQVDGEPAEKPSCFTCAKAFFNHVGATYCSLFNEFIDNETTAAEDCPAYEEE